MNNYLKTFNPMDLEILIDGVKIVGFADDFFLEFDEPLTYCSFKCFAMADTLTTDSTYSLTLRHKDMLLDITGDVVLRSKGFKLSNSVCYTTFYFEGVDK